jgi:hypothetical protein
MKKDPGVELKLSLRSICAVVASVVILAGGHTIYRAIESNQQWIWILFQAAILLFGLLVIMVISGITKE